MATGVAGAGAATSAVVPELYARDAMIAWFRSEFAAANAIIDALCSHLAQIRGATEYESVFAAIHWRRLNWIPVIHMQKFYSIDDVSAELHSVAAKFPAMVPEEEKPKRIDIPSSEEEKPTETDIPPTQDEIAAAEETVAKGVETEATEGAAAEEETSDEAIYHGSIKVARIEDEAVGETEVSPRGDASDFQCAEDGYASKGLQEEQGSKEEVKVCADLGVCLVRPERIKISKGFVAKESVKGHMVNVVKGLKLYENIFAESELPILVEYINELRLAGLRGELPGETFIFFNKQMKGNKREIIQLGVPLFQSATGEAESIIEPIPPALLAIIDHLVQWRLVPESKKPNSCIINFFDEDEHSQPYFKPPHLENPISTLLLSGTTMAFGRPLISDHEGNYKGSLTLAIKGGSLLVMRGNSADMARHVVCASPNKRITITFVKVRIVTQHAESPTAIQSNKAMTLWQPGNSTPLQKVPTSGGIITYGPHAMMPAPWGLALRTPIVVLAPPRAVVMNPDENIARNGTGVFLPWMIRPKKYTKHLPPRIQKRRLLSLPSTLEAQA